MRRLSALAIIALTVPAFAAAQHRGGSASSAPAAAAPSRSATAIPRAAAPARPIARPPVGAQSAPRMGAPVLRARNAGRPIHRNNPNFGNPNFAFNDTNFNDVPGLGFDYPHLAAVSGNRRGRGERFEGGAPFGFSGFLLSPSVIVDEVPAQDSQALESQAVDPQTLGNDQQYAEDVAPPQRPRRSRAPRSADAQPELPPAPPPDVEQYVFVRRDGGLVFAVGYTWENRTLRYITPDGLRRTIGQDALDINATQQFNEQRGVNFRAPA